MTHTLTGDVHYQTKSGDTKKVPRWQNSLSDPVMASAGFGDHNRRFV
jgi:hypothetical protein